jgi:2-amino-4-hydroxy-6-hydroxymethyldihydropteridine diphosphokinase
MSNYHIFVALGANLPGAGGRSALATCQDAAEALAGLAGLRLSGRSRWYRTAAIPAGSPDYINGVVRLTGAADPAWLLARLQRLEQQAGRVRSVANAPRTLDLDIIAMDALVRDAPDPVVPHPRMHLRAFVLAPLCDIAPGWVHPRLGQTAAALLASLPDQGCVPL